MIFRFNVIEFVNVIEFEVCILSKSGKVPVSVQDINRLKFLQFELELLIFLKNAEPFTYPSIKEFIELDSGSFKVAQLMLYKQRAGGVLDHQMPFTGSSHYNEFACCWKCKYSGRSATSVRHYSEKPFYAFRKY